MLPVIRVIREGSRPFNYERFKRLLSSQIFLSVLATNSINSIAWVRFHFIHSKHLPLIPILHISLSQSGVYFVGLWLKHVGLSQWTSPIVFCGIPIGLSMANFISKLSPSILQSPRIDSSRLVSILLAYED